MNLYGSKAVPVQFKRNSLEYRVIIFDKQKTARILKKCPSTLKAFSTHVPEIPLSYIVHESQEPSGLEDVKFKILDVVLSFEKDALAAYNIGILLLLVF